MAEFGSILSNNLFSIVVALWFMLRMEVIIKGYEKSNKELTRAIIKLINRNYDDGCDL